MATSQDLEQQYQQLRANRPSLTTLQQQEEAKLGLPTRQVNLDSINKNLLETTRTLENVGTDVQNRSRQLGSPITEAVRRKLTTVASEPLQQNVYKLSQSGAIESDAINNVRRSVADILGLTIQERGSEDTDFRQRIQDQIRREELAMQQAEAEKDRAFQASLARSSQPKQIDVNALLAALRGSKDDFELDTEEKLPSLSSDNSGRVNAGIAAALVARNKVLARR